MAASLRDNVVFGQHNLATDTRRSTSSTSCSAATSMIHFGPELRRRVHGLLHEEPL